MTTIYAWPRALRYTASLSDEELPVRASRDFFTGEEQVSSAGPRRRVVQVTASALAGDRDGAGICASLNRLLGGGINLVRMRIPPFNWCREQTPLRSEPMGWTNSGSEMTWTDDSSPMVWFTGPLHSVTATTTAAGFAALVVTGLTPGQLVCRAYDVVQTWTVSGATVTLNGTSRAVRTVFADLDGTATIPLHDTLAVGLLSIGGSETAVFRVRARQPSAQTISADFPTSWTLREVLAYEIPEGTTEVDPWV